MPTALLVIAIAGVATQAYGQYQAGKSAEREARTQAAWHAYNAKVAQREKEAEREAAKFEVGQLRRKEKEESARLRSLIGASGVTMEGSPLLRAEDLAAQYTLEEINITKRGLRREGYYESLSILDTSKASAARARGSAARRAGMIGAGASILSGAAQTGYMAYQMRK